MPGGINNPFNAIELAQFVQDVEEFIVGKDFSGSELENVEERINVWKTHPSHKCEESDTQTQFISLLTKYFLVSVHIKERSKHDIRNNPINLIAYWVYQSSHWDRGWNDDESETEKCRHCAGEIGLSNKIRLRELLKLYQLTNPVKREDYYELIETHLTQDELNDLVGHEVNVTEQQKRLEKAFN